MTQSMEQDKLQEEESLETLRQVIQDLSNLLKSRGWELLVKRVEGQIRTREIRVVHTPCASMEAVFEQEYQKGEISGMYNVLKLPEVLITTGNEDVKLREAKLPLEDNENERES